MSAVLQHCPYCGYESEIGNTLPAFASNPYCHKCGLSVSEGDMKVDNDLATLFARQMAVGNIPQVSVPQPTATPPTPSLSSPSSASAPEPIVYSITQHYHHSAHQATPSMAPTDSSRSINPQGVVQGGQREEDMSDEEILRRHKINPDALFQSQIALFRRASLEQKARLVELWQISPPGFGNPPSLQSHAPVNGGQQEYGDSMDHDGGQIHDTDTAEPYVLSGYETLAQREYNLSSNSAPPTISRGEMSASTETSATDYTRSTDPVYKGHDYWQSDPQPIEHQYGAFEARNVYIGCGVARAHWLDDHEML